MSFLRICADLCATAFSLVPRHAFWTNQLVVGSFDISFSSEINRKKNIEREASASRYMEIDNG